MASSSRKQVFCIFHVRGHFVKTSEGKFIYEGGIITGRLIREGMTYEELQCMVAHDVWPGTREYKMKYTVSFDRDTFLDLVDDIGVGQVIEYNNSSGHVYVCENEKDFTQVSQLDSVQELDDLVGPCGMSVSAMELDLDTDNINISSVQDVPTLIGSVGMETLPTPIAVMNSSKWADLLMSRGQTFVSAEHFREALYKYSLAHKFGYRYVKNDRHKMIVKCCVEGCPWEISAYGVGENNGFLVVRRFNYEHLHYAQDNLVVPQRKRCKLASAVIIDELISCMHKAPNDIRRDLEREYGLRLNYQQAYRAKEKALEKIHGCPQESYMLIPWICERLKESDPETVAKWVASSDNRFQAVFIAYGCCVEGFLKGGRPVLYVDGCHLSGPYKGTLLGAQAYDADNELFPLAYAIVGGETLDDWAWFLGNIKDITGSLEVTIVSDRHNSIKGAVQAVFGGDRHAFCYRHVKENYSAEFLKKTRGKRRTSGQTKEVALKLLDSIAYARLDRDFDCSMEKLMAFCPELGQWLQTNGDIDRWAQSKFPYKRWDNITTNLAESFNAWLVGERKHNIAVLIHEHREKLANKMYHSKEAMTNWSNGVGPNIEEKLMDHVARSERMDVQNYGMNNFRVRWGNLDVRVNLVLRECTCKGWQILMIPVETHDIPRPDSLRYEDYSSTIFLQPPLTTRRAGRPRGRRIESQFQQKKAYHCSGCGEAGHTRKICTNPNPG
ncbi:uncharacterized protein LOC114733520 [Neltuma alba]|uniref:uncharacterized protein LOC114733520 n=1 Tax=Neltuma alba TaxID=207710 RepID=UPI0010A42128|nr:uncharacterized protein LOC114733520 [Prosopis alba]